MTEKGKNFSANNTTDRRKQTDFYETPYSLTRKFLDVEEFDKSLSVCEPACGKGAITKVLKSNRPSIISCKTIIGFGSPNKSGKASSHGAPLGEDEIKLVRKKLGWKYQPFEIPENVLNSWREIGNKGEELEFKFFDNLYKSFFKDPSPIRVTSSVRFENDSINLSKFFRLFLNKLLEFRTNPKFFSLIKILILG